ncbi:MAG TPA: hypothetical protein DCZ91_00590 [Lachnospiraceae bacterium]|nr:hypothetical protein [Lachnospiraceae bacterium]
MALTNDDLLAISQLLDVKLKAEIQPIKNEMQTLRNEIQAVKTELHGEIQAVKAELQAEIHQIKLYQENIMMPRLDTIESCYTSTYNRYKDSVEGYEMLQEDNKLMKDIIMEHSRQLQKLA